MRRKPIIALIYDFDGTLSPGNMQEFGFIQAIGSTPEEFWSKSDGIAKGQDASNILAYMKLMFDEARKNGIRLTREDFRRYGSDIVLFEGVREWFRNVNEYGRRHGVIIEHYINSSGLKEIIPRRQAREREHGRGRQAHPLHPDDLFRGRRDRHPVHEGREHGRRQRHRRVQSDGSPQARIGPKTPQTGPCELHHAGHI